MRHCNSRQKIWLGNGIFIIWSLLYPYASALIAQPITPSRNLWPAKAAKIEGQPLQTPQALWEKQKDVLKVEGPYWKSRCHENGHGPLPQNL